MSAHWTEEVNRLQPVLFVTQYRADANLLTEQMRGFVSSVASHWAQTAQAAMTVAKARSPRLVFVELEGLGFVRDLRRSGLPCREAPVIVLSSQPTLRAMREAQNSGAHEFLVRPFSAYQLAKRLQAVADPRPWIETASYVGPDRRRFNSAALLGPDRRHGAGPHDRAAVKAAS